MPDPTAVNPQIIDTINQSQSATMAPQVVLTSGSGKAYQLVAQASAIAVQDATDMLRNMSSIATSAVGTAMAQLLSGDPGAAEAARLAQAIVTQAAADYARICEAAAKSLREFPSG